MSISAITLGTLAFSRVDLSDKQQKAIAATTVIADLLTPLVLIAIGLLAHYHVLNLSQPVTWSLIGAGAALGFIQMTILFGIAGVNSLPDEKTA